MLHWGYLFVAKLLKLKLCHVVATPNKVPFYKPDPLL
jgi:hypothetical protein